VRLAVQPGEECLAHRAIQAVQGQELGRKDGACAFAPRRALARHAAHALLEIGNAGQVLGHDQQQGQYEQRLVEVGLEGGGKDDGGQAPEDEDQPGIAQHLPPISVLQPVQIPLHRSLRIHVALRACQ